MMSGIGSKDTKPELLVRKALHARGLRFALGGRGLPGKPDIVLPKWQAAVFVHGCFWHRHECRISKLPSSRKRFWKSKLSANRDRDTVAVLALLSAGWRIAIVWECSLRGKAAVQQLDLTMNTLADWIRTGGRHPFLELPPNAI